ncbi:hypothetical protein SAMN05216296_1310 [Pseudomonas pohangensis]|uniref:Lipoprotein n=1 Tax=Pseudomonas pohangensis TaxID=364197 RepID=A0A1H2F4I9_9PSED|nr:hypothetical protein [Pseudomonas pohangensis]SDU02183.1 hypothetical protein SAMN05216296_1310 [Pseudomonas pohangensis]
MNLRTLTVLLLLGGCASRSPEPPPVVVPQSTWEWVDWDIVAASQTAADGAQAYARSNMEQWKTLVRQRTEKEFIPWYSGYWTQQWLGMKVAWYQVREGGESEATAARLAGYLQEEYQDQVLDPVARQISPELIREQTTHFYVYHLGKQLQQIPERYAVPEEQFEQRLQEIPAISLGAPPARRASLYQLVNTVPLGKLPAYKALSGRINAAADNAAENASGKGISAVAQRAGEKLESELATRGAASSLSAVVGKAASLIISVGSAAYGVVAHQAGKAEMEAQLGTVLNQAFEEDWQALLDDREAGVLAGVYYLSAEIEGNRLKLLTRPLQMELPPAGIAAPAKPALEYQQQPAAPVDYPDMYRPR